MANIFKKIGNALNDITGASSSARSQFSKQMQLQQDAQNFSKWQMQNAHQTEVQDLQNAGLNPVLSAGGSGASAGVTEGTASTGINSGNPIEMIGQIIAMKNQTEQTHNNTAKTTAEINNETEMTRANVAKALAEAGVKQNEIDYYVKYGVFPGATVKLNAGGKVSGPFGSGISVEGGGEIPIGLKNTARQEQEKERIAKDKKRRKDLPKGLSGLW